MIRAVLCLLMVSSSALPQTLRNPQDSTRVPNNDQGFGNADIARQLAILSERMDSIKETLGRIEREQEQIKVDLKTITSEQTAAKARAEGKREAAEESLQWATLMSRILVPLFASGIGAVITLFVARKSWKQKANPTEC